MPCFVQFTRPTRDSFIRIFGQKEDEMFLSINAKTSSAVTYPGPSDTFGRTLTFNINSCQLPFNQTFYVLFDPGNFIVKYNVHIPGPGYYKYCVNFVCDPY